MSLKLSILTKRTEIERTASNLKIDVLVSKSEKSIIFLLICAMLVLSLNV